MTIEVIVKNNDKREDAVIQVQKFVSETDAGQNPVTLKPQEEQSFWVHSGARLVVTESVIPATVEYMDGIPGPGVQIDGQGLEERV
jgi:hypothetical protein